MNLNIWNMLLLGIGVSLVASSWLYGSNVVKQNDDFYSYQEAFKGAVSDTGVYLSQFESQQLTTSVRYSKEKEVAIDMDVISSFYENVAFRFGMQDNPGVLQEIIQHTPVMAIINYDSYQIVTPQIQNGILKPIIGEGRPFTQVLDSGDVLYYNLDNTATLYDKTNNRFLESPITDLLAYKSLSPINSVDDFEVNKQVTIVKGLQSSMEAAITQYNELMNKNGYNVRFSLPVDLAEARFSDVGFLAYIQGYPLPNGDTISSFSFGASRVSRGNEYNGVIRSDGRHVAYEKSCGVPANTFMIEVLYGEKEAARKGYFVEPCMSAD